VDVLGWVSAIIPVGLEGRWAQLLLLAHVLIRAFTALDGDYPPPLWLVVAHVLIAPVTGYSSADQLTIIKIGTDIAHYSPGSLSPIPLRF
jgi:hypothetical protein